MNLRRIGTIIHVIVTTSLATLGIGACTSSTAPTQRLPAASNADLWDDRINDWSDGSLKHGIKGGELGVTTLLEIRPNNPFDPDRRGFREQYFAVGALGDRCMVIYRNFDTEGRTRVEISPRWEGDSFNYKADSFWIGPKEVVKYWVLSREQFCTTQPL